MKKEILLLLWGIFLMLELAAQSPKIIGNVLLETKEQASYCTIFLIEENKILNATYTDENGKFIFEGLHSGSFSLKIERIGYATEIIAPFTLVADETKSIDITLREAKSQITLVTDLEGGEDLEEATYDDGGATEGGEVSVSLAKKTIPSSYPKAKSPEGKGTMSEAMYGEIKKDRFTTKTAPMESAYKGKAKKIEIGKEATGSESHSGEEMGGGYIDVIEEEDNADFAGKLTAGEINDFSKWKMWRGIAKDEFKPFQNEWKMIPEERYMVQVENAEHHPIANLKVTLMSGETVVWTGRTDNTGKVELWKNFFRAIPQPNGRITSIRIFYEGGMKEVREVKPMSKGMNRVTLNLPCTINRRADIAFVVDATGSMGDEIAHIRADLGKIASDLRDTLKNWEVNFGSVFYQDKGDEYLTRASAFSEEVAVTKKFMTETPYGGGGDFPEAVEAGLEEAIQSLKWNDHAATRIIFLVLDAPSHEDIETLLKLQMQIRAAAHKGIRIIPVACSGIDKSTEYLLRSIALATNGTYTFLTDDSGIGNPHIKPSTDEYKVEKFAELAVRLVCQYTFQPDCQPEITQKPQTETVFQTQIVEKKENKVSNDKDEIVFKDSLSQTVWVREKNISWKYYPNPTQGILTIEVEDNIGEIFLSDITGKTLDRVEVQKGESFQIDLSPYTNGIYFLRYEYESDKWLNGKVILER